MRNLYFPLALSLITAVPLGAQGLSNLNFSGIPSWADSALRKAGVPGHYHLTSSINPEVQWGDFDGDGFLDVVLAIVPAGNRQRGLAIVHRVDRSVHIIGAGQPLGNGKNELPASAGLAVERRWPYRDVVRVDGWGTLHGWIAWNSSSYVWVQDSY
ncbi:MAG TPA: hypothetical protein VK573_08325 [Gemmatimonadales bacterium]|nr:hypothetical protein [Gemmatimonadales bacterium]